jgi:hypothetical protein
MSIDIRISNSLRMKGSPKTFNEFPLATILILGKYVRNLAILEF